MPAAKDTRPRVDAVFSSPVSGSSATVRALLDTGAMRTCVPESLVSSLGPNLEWDLVHVRGPVGSPARVRAVILNLRVGKTEFENLNCVVLDTRNEALLGWDVLSNDVVFAAVPSQPLFTNLALMLEHVSLFKERYVLVLGQDTTEIARLRAIQSALEPHRYSGLVMRDISDTKIQCLEEKVNMLGSLCRFVVCENTTPSGHIAELQICTRNRLVTAILQQSGRRATQMQADYGLDFAFVGTFEYAGVADIGKCVDRAVRWADGKLAEREKYLSTIYKSSSRQ